MSSTESESILGSNEVWFWGDGKYGQIGIGDRKKKKFPVFITGLKNIGIIQVSCGGKHCAGITANGHLYVWGDGSSGCLGRGDFLTLTIPRRVLLEETRVLQVACGVSHTCFLTFQNKMYSTGNNDYGQLGTGNTTSSCIPQKIDILDKVHVAKIFCGPTQSACIDDKGIFYCWGDSQNGQTCHVSRFNLLQPKIVESFIEIPIKEVSFGENHGACLTVTGECYFWGCSLIDFGKPDCLVPSKITFPRSTTISQISCGSFHIAFLTDKGLVYTMGCGLNGQLGLGTKESKDTPQIVRTGNITQIASGKYHVLAISENGYFYTWGDNQKFQLALTQYRRESTLPTQVMMFGKQSILQVIAGGCTSGILAAPGENLIETRPKFGRNFADSLPRLISVDLSTIEKLTVLVLSWNVNAKLGSELESWFSSPVSPDIIAIGLQELIKLNSHSLAKDQINNLTMQDPHSKPWKKLFEETLNKCFPEAHYVSVKDLKLAGLYLCVFVKVDLKSSVEDCRSSTVAAGVLGKLANKGAIAVRFTINGNSFCFVTSHLAAGQNYIEKRNLDYKNIATNINFEFPERNQSLSIFDHQNIFWFGDLNYRIEMSKSAIERIIEKKEFESLRKYDQLLIEKRENRVFEGFTEPNITFAPTYKFDPGTQTYDTSEKMRSPAWCDRILYRGPSIRCVLYSSHPSYVMSDHKPVSSIFQVSVKVPSPSTPNYFKIRKVFSNNESPNNWKKSNQNHSFVWKKSTKESTLRKQSQDDNAFLANPRLNKNSLGMMRTNNNLALSGITDLSTFEEESATICNNFSSEEGEDEKFEDEKEEKLEKGPEKNKQIKIGIQKQSRIEIEEIIEEEDSSDTSEEIILNEEPKDLNMLDILMSAQSDDNISINDIINEFNQNNNSAPVASGELNIVENPITSIDLGGMITAKHVEESISCPSLLSIDDIELRNSEDSQEIILNNLKRRSNTFIPTKNTDSQKKNSVQLSKYRLPNF